MVEMNWDTKEAAMLITNEKKYYDTLQNHIGNELYFMVVLFTIIQQYNNKNEPVHRINTAKVNGNEVYIDFCDACGNETQGWK